MATWTAPRTFVDGEVETAAIFNTHVRDNFLAIGQAWTSYTPTWTGSTNPAIGNGTIAGAYLSAGKLTIARFKITMGSTTTYGTGGWIISLPVTANSAVVESVVGGSACYDVGVNRYARNIYCVTTTTVQFISEAGTFVTPTSPFTWGTGDIFSGQFVYEAA